MTKAPCYKCSRHEFGCKKNCNEWIEWQVIHANEKAAIERDKREHLDADAHTKKVIERNCKRAHTKRRVGQR